MLAVKTFLTSLLFGLILGGGDDCVSRKKVGAIADSLLDKRKGMNITLSPDNLEDLASLKYGSASREQEGRIYFSAFLKSGRTTQISNEIIKFDDLTVNEGKGYDPKTGKFTCPKTGSYLLSFGFLSAHSKGIHAQVYINGNVGIHAYTPGDAVHNSAERSSVHPLKKGDEVFVRVSESGSKLYGYRYTSFSAVYLN